MYSIRETIKDNLIYEANTLTDAIDFAYNLTQYLDEQYDTELESVDFSNKDVSCAATIEKRIRYSYADIEEAYHLNFFTEYIEVCHIWREFDYQCDSNKDYAEITSDNSFECIYMLVLHEFAHILHCQNLDFFEDLELTDDEIHAKDYQEKLRELLTLVPFEEIIGRMK